MKKPIPTIKCVHCEGKGQTPLSSELVETLATLGRLWKKVAFTAPDVASAMSLKLTTAHARLVKLNSAGLLERSATREGRLFRYWIPIAK